MERFYFSSRSKPPTNRPDSLLKMSFFQQNPSKFVSLYSKTCIFLLEKVLERWGRPPNSPLGWILGGHPEKPLSDSRGGVGGGTDWTDFSVFF